jgi:nucleotide sugar dehydrogenase
MTIRELIENKNAKVAIIGMGYVGLPHAIEIANAGMEVIGLDIQQKRVDALNRGESYVQDVKNDNLKKIAAAGKFQASTDFSLCANADILIICVPTPLDKYKIPDVSYIVNAANEVKKYLRQGQLVILESTTYPGTTEEILLPLLKETGLKCG